MSKLSIHISGSPSKLRELLEKCHREKSPVGVLYSLNQNVSDDIRRASPQTQWVYRRQSGPFQRLPDGFFTGDPAESARNWLLYTRDRADRNRNQIENILLNNPHYADILNEPSIEIADPNDPAQIEEAVRRARWLNAWMMEALEIAHSYGVRLALFSFPTQSPPSDARIWNELVPCMRLGKKYGAILSLHCYGDPDGDRHPGYLSDLPSAYRQHESIYQLIPEDAKLPVIYSEAGAGNGYNTGVKGQPFIDDMARCDAYWMTDGYVMAGCAFQLGVNVESNMAEIMDGYGDYIASHPNTVVPPILVESPDNATIPPSDKIVDSSLRTWTFGSAVPMGNVILRDGVQFAGGQGNLLLYWSKKVYTRNANNEWYVAGESWSRVDGDPRVSSAPFRLQSPVRGIPFRVTDEFNEPRGYANGKHEGVDLDCYDDINYRSVDILAAADGVIEYIRTSGYGSKSYGKYIVVRHDFPGQVYKTWYCHLSSVSCSVGQSVKAGDKVGVGGNSGTDAIHLHLNLQKTGGGLHGYYVDDVVDPLPYFDVEPPPSNVGLVPIRSVHGRADGGQLISVDIQAAKVSRLINGYKLYKNSRDDFAYLRSNGFKMENVLVRLDHVKDRRVNSEFYINPQGTGIWDLPIKEAVQEGVLWVELFNEPNLGVEGNGVAWSSADDFCGLLKQIILAIRSKYPSAKMLSPAISPQPDTQAWWDVMNRIGIFGLVDGLAAHSYWDSVNGSYPMNSVSGGRHYRGLFKYLTGTKKVHVTEASNNAGVDSDRDKGNQYGEYFKTMEPQVARVDIFCVSSSDVGDGALFNQRRETWVRGTTISPIPSNILP